MNSVGQTTPKTYIISPCLKTWFKIKFEFEFKFKFEFKQKKKNEKEKKRAGPATWARLGRSGPNSSPRPSPQSPLGWGQQTKKEKGQAATGPGPLASTPLHGPLAI